MGTKREIAEKIFRKNAEETMYVFDEIGFKAKYKKLYEVIIKSIEDGIMISERSVSTLVDKLTKNIQKI